jgi:hypothetical protein
MSETGDEEVTISSVYDYHSDDSEIISDLHDELGVWLIELLEQLSSDCSATSDHAAQQLRSCMIRTRTLDYVRNCFFKSAFEETIRTTPSLFQNDAQRVRLFKRILDYFPEVISEQLIDLSAKSRLKAITIFVSIFKSANELKYSFVYRSVQTEPLLSRLISRYRDADESVRMEWVTLAFMVMDTSMNTNGLWDEVFKCLTDMLMRERVAEIRSEALSAVHQTVLTKPHFELDNGLTMALIHRVGDKIREIRMQAIPSVQQIYQRFVECHADDDHRRYRIASSLMLLYTKSDNQQEQFTMERALYQSLFDVMERDPKQRADNIVNTMLNCTVKSVAGIGAAVTRAKSMRILFLKMLIAVSEGDKSSHRRQLDKLSSYFDWHNDAKRKFAAIVSRIDEELFEPILRLFSDAADLTYDEVTDTLQQFNSLTEGSLLEDLHYDFLIRSGVMLNDRATHMALIDIIDQKLSNKLVDMVRCSGLLLFWMSIYDRFFAVPSVQDHLKQVLQRNPHCLRILWASRNKLTISDDFWNACLPPDGSSPPTAGAGTPDSDPLSAGSASTASSRVATPEPVDEDEGVESDPHQDMDVEEEEMDDSHAEVQNEPLEEAVKTMADASISLVGEPILSEESSPDQSQGTTDMSLE